jgi:hypothetical protein
MGKSDFGLARTGPPEEIAGYLESSRPGSAAVKSVSRLPIVSCASFQAPP